MSGARTRRTRSVLTVTLPGSHDRLPLNRARYAAVILRAPTGLETLIFPVEVNEIPLLISRTMGKEPTPRPARVVTPLLSVLPGRAPVVPLPTSAPQGPWGARRHCRTRPWRRCVVPMPETPAPSPTGPHPPDRLTGQEAGFTPVASVRRTGTILPSPEDSEVSDRGENCPKQGWPSTAAPRHRGTTRYPPPNCLHLDRFQE